mmetsp:Transcript_29097/g.70201  ORF Transcript_29097/g.70201 Transcript_29097/m.70201 type:complete len:133 (+) Transcript_29097:694-1092(+)
METVSRGRRRPTWLPPPSPTFRTFLAIISETTTLSWPTSSSIAGGEDAEDDDDGAACDHDSIAIVIRTLTVRKKGWRGLWGHGGRRRRQRRPPHARFVIAAEASSLLRQRIMEEGGMNILLWSDGGFHPTSS